jgi:hypothetical protein
MAVLYFISHIQIMLYLTRSIWQMEQEHHLLYEGSILSELTSRLLLDTIIKLIEVSLIIYGDI